jgi:hypothetical protein
MQRYAATQLVAGCVFKISSMLKTVVSKYILLGLSMECCARVILIGVTRLPAWVWTG